MGVFFEHAPAYRAAGLEVRPIKPGEKACKEKGWNKPDSELPDGTMDRWLKTKGGYGLGLRLGTTLPGGLHLGALDIDDDRFVRVANVLLGNPPCGRIGSKGIAYFVRIKGQSKKKRDPLDLMQADSGKVHVGEVLTAGTLLVIPPTVHPGTNEPYRWQGESLLETQLDQLPIIEV